MLFRETVAVYCENHTEHTDKLRGQNAGLYYCHDLGVCYRGSFMGFREIGWDGMDWIDLARCKGELWALVITVMNLRVPLNVGIFLSS
jgi:hypothetical protein